MQLIGAGLQYFLGGVVLTMPTLAVPQLQIAVTLYDQSSTLVASNTSVLVQVLSYLKTMIAQPF